MRSDYPGREGQVHAHATWAVVQWREALTWCFDRFPYLICRSDNYPSLSGHGWFYHPDTQRPLALELVAHDRSGQARNSAVEKAARPYNFIVLIVCSNVDGTAALKKWETREVRQEHSELNPLRHHARPRALHRGQSSERLYDFANVVSGLLNTLQRVALLRRNGSQSFDLKHSGIPMHD